MIGLYPFKIYVLHFHFTCTVHFFILVQPVWGSPVPTCGFMCSSVTPCEELEKPLSHHWASPILTTLPKQKIPLSISVRSLSRHWADFVSMIVEDLAQSESDQINWRAPFLFLSIYLFIFCFTCSLPSDHHPPGPDVWFPARLLLCQIVCWRWIRWHG